MPRTTRVKNPDDSRTISGVLVLRCLVPTPTQSVCCGSEAVVTDGDLDVGFRPGAEYPEFFYASVIKNPGNHMQLEVLSVAAEAIGAIGVLVTLVYLAIQTRDNTRVLRARAVWDAQTSFVEVNEQLGDGGLVSKLVYRALQPDQEFSEYETYLLQRFLRGWMQRMEAQFALYKAGILDEDVWVLRKGYAKAVLKITALTEIWELEKKNSMFTPAFVAALDDSDEQELAGFSGIDQANS